VILDRARKQKLEGGNKANIFKDRRAEVFANPSYLGRNRLNLFTQLGTQECSLVRFHHQVPQVGECLVMQVTSNSASFTFCFISEVESRGSQFAISFFDPSVLEHRPNQTNHGNRQQYS